MQRIGQRVRKPCCMGRTGGRDQVRTSSKDCNVPRGHSLDPEISGKQKQKDSKLCDLQSS